jgi:hypothetical protein
VSAVRDQTKETIAATKALKNPDRWAIVTFSCTGASCSSMAYWIDRPSKQILALARVSKPKTDGGALGADGDKGALSKALGAAIAKWK